MIPGAEEEGEPEPYDAEVASEFLPRSVASGTRRRRALEAELMRLTTLMRQGQRVVDECAEAAEGERATAKDVDRLLRASKLVEETSRRIVEVETLLDAMMEEERDAPLWDERERTMVGALLAVYAEQGPQYEHLCRSLARTVVARERMEARGGLMTAAEIDRAAELTRTQIALTNQLQKYTEAEKTEMVHREVQGAVERIIRLAEEVVAPEAPRLWASLVRRIEQAARDEE